MVQLSGIEKICVGVVGGALLVSFVGATHIAILAVLVGGASYGWRNFLKGKVKV